MNAVQKIKQARREATRAKMKTGGSNVSQSRPHAARGNQPSYDPSGRYNLARLGLSSAKPHGRDWQQGGKPSGKIIPSTEYVPRAKSPSRRDAHRAEVAARKKKA
jgi:hypothetical protein